MAKILIHSQGLGALNASQVRERAQEIALINGHTRYTEEDWRHARVELHGAHQPDGEFSAEMAASSMVSEGDMLAIDTGHHTARLPLEDELNLVEELWLEGMEEAEHDRMVEACETLREEEEIEGL